MGSEVLRVTPLVPFAVLMTLTLALSGCTTKPSSGTGSGGSSGSTLTGNWQFDATPTSANAPFTALSGYLHEAGASASQFTTIDVLVHSTGCYLETRSIPLKGSVTGSTLSVSSFEVNGQNLTITAQPNAAGNSMSGTYSIYGGCANGDAGTIVGTRYAALAGTYSGAITGDASKTISLALTQDLNGTGDGTFLLSGTGAFTGLSCFSSGTLVAGGAYVSGSFANLTLTTNDPNGAQLAVVGTFDTAADTLTVSSLSVIGGSCPGALGTATLTQ